MRLKYLKHIELPYFTENEVWFICPFTGSLLHGEPLSKVQENIPSKVLQALEYCNNPYLCLSNHTTQSSPVDNGLTLRINKMHDRLVKIGNNRFYLTRIYSSIKHELFESTNTAIININNLSTQIEQKHRLCLQRAFLASKISKGFVKNGVIFIGAALPTGDMHAWIIENGVQPDFDDRSWVNYRPLLAFYH